MEGYWLKFTDNTSAYCEGQSKGDAIGIAEHLTGKQVALKPGHTGPRPPTYQGDKFEAERLPYPATPIVWQFDHPKSGKCPAFCWKPNECKGRTACPQNRSCTE